VRLANVIDIMAANTAALIQMNVWISRNFSSCSSAVNNSRRSCTLARKPSPSERSELR